MTLGLGVYGSYVLLVRYWLGTYLAVIGFVLPWYDTRFPMFKMTRGLPPVCLLSKRGKIISIESKEESLR